MWTAQQLDSARFSEHSAPIDGQADPGDEVVFQQKGHGLGHILGPAGATKERARNGPLSLGLAHVIWH